MEKKHQDEFDKFTVLEVRGLIKRCKCGRINITQLRDLTAKEADRFGLPPETIFEIIKECIHLGKAKAF